MDQSQPMQQQEHVVSFYERVLNSLGAHFDQNGLISLSLDEDTVTPAVVDAYRLVMPTAERLAKPKPEGQLYFHPLSESSVRAESPVFRFLKTAVNFRLNSTMITMLEILCQLATDPEKQKTLGNQIELLAPLADPPKSAYDKLTSVIKNSDLTTDRRFINVFIMRGGRLGDRACARVATVSFPLLSALQEGNKEVWGVKLTEKERVFLINLHKVLLPDCDVEQHYSYGSHSKKPNFDALFGAYLKVYKVLNSTIWAFRKHCNSKHLHVNLDWGSSMKHIDIMAEHIPPQEGNIGDLPKGQVDTTVNAPLATTPVSGANMFNAVAQPAVPAAQVAPVQTVAPQPTVWGPGGILSAPMPEMTPEQREQAEWAAAAMSTALPAAMPMVGAFGMQQPMGFMQASVVQFQAADSSAAPAVQQAPAPAPVQVPVVPPQPQFAPNVLQQLQMNQAASWGNNGWGGFQAQPQQGGVLAGFGNQGFQQAGWGQQNGWGQPQQQQWGFGMTGQPTSGFGTF